MKIWGIFIVCLGSVDVVIFMSHCCNEIVYLCPLTTIQAPDKNHTNNTHYSGKAKPSTSPHHDIKADTNTTQHDKQHTISSDYE